MRLLFAISLSAFVMLVAQNVRAATPEAPLPLAGRFGFYGQVEPVQKMLVEIVRMAIPGADKRVADLVANGFSCDPVTLGSARCRKFVGLQSPDAKDEAEIRNRFLGQVVEFDIVKAPPVLTNLADIYSEWTVGQKVTIGSLSFLSYRIRVYENGRWSKVILSSEVEFFKYADETQIRQPLDLRRATKSGYEIRSYDLVYFLNM
jgi:hypothetical protein